ncbi:MAG: dihydroorotase [Gammaproteobacteria bacterium]|nr:MAG: dihydroorotase [Gammaproteobacteria bacterium]
MPTHRAHPDPGLLLPAPLDAHPPLRDGPLLALTVPHAARCFARAVVMPNLRPPVTDTAAALAYRERILAHLPRGLAFEPLMTLYLTEATPPAEIRRAREAGIVGVKLYPAGATTASEAGVRELARVEPVLAAMAEEGLPLLVHAEVADPAVDVFDRERVFLEEQLAPLLERHPRLRVVVEHLSTREGVAFVRQAREGVAATLTAHHLLLNRNHLLAGGIRPHHYCLPVLKREEDRRALLAAAVSGEPRFFLGTDSAPHPRRLKEGACGCAGIYTSPQALAWYAQAFEAAGALDRLEAFACRHGPAFYGLEGGGQGAARRLVHLERREEPVPPAYEVAGEEIVPLGAGEVAAWRPAETSGAAPDPEAGRPGPGGEP